MLTGSGLLCVDASFSNVTEKHTVIGKTEAMNEVRWLFIPGPSLYCLLVSLKFEC